MTENDRILQEYSNPENIKILESVAKKFKLDRDEIESCKLIALWKTIKADVRDVKFTTSLYNHMTWQCKDRIKILKKGILVNSVYDKSISKDMFSDIIDMVLSEKDGDMVIDKYVYNLTLKEISRKNGLTIEQTRLKINAAKERIALNNPE
jgi:hypothetical protein